MPQIYEMEGPRYVPAYKGKSGMVSGFVYVRPDPGCRNPPKPSLEEIDGDDSRDNDNDN